MTEDRLAPPTFDPADAAAAARRNAFEGLRKLRQEMTA